MNVISRSAQSIFRGAKIIDDWIGLPEKLSETLHFRLDWKIYLPSLEPQTPGLWIHGASVGELEDLANFFLNKELLKEAGFEMNQVILTSSSISARNQLKKWAEGCDFRYAGPLPPEDKADTVEFFRFLKPRLLVLSHSDIWPVLMSTAKTALPKGCLWLPKAAPKWRILERRFLRPLVSMVALRDKDFAEREVPSHFVGNPRVDRICDRIEQARLVADHVLKARDCEPKSDRINILLGSAWAKDAEVWQAALQRAPKSLSEQLHLVVIPHEIGDAHEVARIQNLLPGARVVPMAGILLEAYRDFDLAYVGGAFGSGLHNILEPALWGIPVICGPDTRKQPDAAKLSRVGGLKSLRGSDELATFLGSLDLKGALEKRKEQSKITGLTLEGERGASLRLAKLISTLV
jgi:3-deoxy-D-manno-octulosonic-acid transferase